MISYLVLPPIFVLGLLLVPFGWWLHVRRSPHSWRELLAADFGDELVAPRASGSRLFALVAVLTLVNIAFLGGGSARMLQFMEEPVFCGTACHSVMNPEWTTYQDSPHARVACVECHVGEGADALIDSKLNGLWQLVSLSFDLYDRPIPTPVHQLRPSRETCEHCHWPDKVMGDRIKTWRRFEMDRASTPTFTTLNLHVGSSEGGGIHWHVHPDNQVRYASVADERESMLWVETRAADGAPIRYQDAGRTVDPAGDEHVRTMDCVDCHNRATHIYEDPEDVVDDLIATGAIDRRIPFARRTSLEALTGSWRDHEMAMAGIERELHRTTEATDPRGYAALQPELDAAVVALREAYDRNIHERMGISWGAYPSHLGHPHDGAGCFRCHHEDMVDEEGGAIPYECELCHDLLAWDSPTPYAFLGEPPDDDPEKAMYWAAQAALLGAGPGSAPAQRLEREHPAE
ncbi:MAG: NapC/NirT family cytochrome c, partial [Deltaproteobacteria bacterium]|nr:NapC/NirT family cytochrome c [Deltaproteobacteria bacterium]